MKLNVGSSNPSGRYRSEDWVCLDLNREAGPDVVGSGFQLPFADASFDTVHSVHVLEHLSRDKWPIMLSEIFRVLEEDGVFLVEVPDFEAQCCAYLRALSANRDEKAHKVRTGIWGKTERPGMGHQFGFDKALLRRALHKIGFQEVELLVRSEDMISRHYTQDSVLLFKCVKRPGGSALDVRSLSFDALRDNLLK